MTGRLVDGFLGFAMFGTIPVCSFITARLRAGRERRRMLRLDWRPR